MLEWYWIWNTEYLRSGAIFVMAWCNQSYQVCNSYQESGLSQHLHNAQDLSNHVPLPLSRKRWHLVICLSIWILQEKVKPALIIASVIGRPLVTTSIFGKTPLRVGTMQRPCVPAATATSPPSPISKSKTSWPPRWWNQDHRSGSEPLIKMQRATGSGLMESRWYSTTGEQMQ